jgi:hypothetical protein
MNWDDIGGRGREKIGWITVIGTSGDRKHPQIHRRVVSKTKVPPCGGTKLVG